MLILDILLKITHADLNFVIVVVTFRYYSFYESKLLEFHIKNSVILAKEGIWYFNFSKRKDLKFKNILCHWSWTFLQWVELCKITSRRRHKKRALKPKKHIRPRQDSNLQSPDSKSGALSIGPRGRSYEFTKISLIINSIKIGWP